MGECIFGYRPTRVVPDKRPLNGCVCVCACVRVFPTLTSCVSERLFSVNVSGVYFLFSKQNRNFVAEVL